MKINFNKNFIDDIKNRKKYGECGNVEIVEFCEHTAAICFLMGEIGLGVSVFYGVGVIEINLFKIRFLFQW